MSLPCTVVLGRLPEGVPMRADHGPDHTTITWDTQQASAEEVAAIIRAVQLERAASITE